MKPELIVMLTHHDKTVKDAKKLFIECKDLPVRHWGFKDLGLPRVEMVELVDLMRQAGKTTYLEVVSLSEQEGQEGAKLAVEAGFDILMGTVYFPSVKEYLQDKPIKYYPFPGQVHGHPSILDGSIVEIVHHARFLASCGVDGLDLLTYRYSGNAAQLLQAVVSAVDIPVVSAGSIASYGRIAEVWRANTQAFTIGSAFFEQKFIPGGSFRENVQAVAEWLYQTEE
jgi:CheY-like chemotaxis protein